MFESTTKPPRKVLIVSPHWPPVNAPDLQRVRMSLSYYRQYGWEPVVLAVHPDYALQGRRSGVGLGVTLFEKVKEIAARIVGVQRIVFFYRQEVVIRLGKE